MSSWHNLLDEWQRSSGILVRKPVEPQLLESMSSSLRGFPEDLLDFYSVCNGLSEEWLSILPIEDPSNISNTWDGIERANNPKTTKFMNRDVALLERFLVFAEVGPMQCAVFDRTNHSIWYEENEELIQTNLSLESFIATCLKEIAEL